MGKLIKKYKTIIIYYTCFLGIVLSSQKQPIRKESNDCFSIVWNCGSKGCYCHCCCCMMQCCSKIPSMKPKPAYNGSISLSSLEEKKETHKYSPKNNTTIGLENSKDIKSILSEKENTQYSHHEITLSDYLLNLNPSENSYSKKRTTKQSPKNNTITPLENSKDIKNIPLEEEDNTQYSHDQVTLTDYPLSLNLGQNSSTRL